jgi:hypothetical protein
VEWHDTSEEVEIKIRKNIERLVGKKIKQEETRPCFFVCLCLYIHTDEKILKFNGKIFWKDVWVFMKLVSLIRKKKLSAATLRISYSLGPASEPHCIELQNGCVIALTYTHSGLKDSHCCQPKRQREMLGASRLAFLCSRHLSNC